MDSKDGINKSLTSTNKWTYVPGKTFTLLPLNFEDIRKQLLESAQEETEDDDTENAVEDTDGENTVNINKTEEFEAVNVERTNSLIEEQDLCTSITRPKMIINSPKEIENGNHTHITTEYKINDNSIPRSLATIVEDSIICREHQETFKNKENISSNIEPLNLSNTNRKTDDSFDLDLSALTLHTPIKKKEKPFNYMTPKINIVPPTETKSTNKTGPQFKTPNISKNPFALKKLFRTPVSKPAVPLQYSARKQGTPYQAHQKTFSNHRNELPETSEEKIPTPSVLHSKLDGFERITVNNTEYIVMNLLGRGGSSEVFHCFNMEEKVHVAIKVVSLSEPTTAEGYINEVRLLKSLQGCDRIITMYDYEICDEQLLVVLENGAGDLSTILKELAKKQSYLPLYKLIYYWMEMLYAVKQIHSNGVIHSDLKPANFLRANSGLKLIDFGIASKVQEDMTCVFKSNQEGSCNYISPEALNVHTNGNVNSPSFRKPKYKVHFKSDVWSLGCILYQLVYRKTPFQHLNPIWSKLAAIIDPKHKIEYPQADWVPARIVDTIKRCLQHDIKSRPSVDELIEEYKGVLRI